MKTDYRLSPAEADLATLTGGSPYQSYVYSYPHKTAYRPIEPGLSLADLWREENRSALFLYMHIPFCEMRCGFCNLFTTVSADADWMGRYVDSLRRQASVVRAALGEGTAFARFALGGGTPTRLPLAHLEALFTIANEVMGAPLERIPISVEVSPETSEPEKLALLKAHHVDRLSIGVQSFVDAEVGAVGRRQRTTQVEAALERIRGADFSTLNIDLMYGLPGQTIESWLFSIRTALRYRPEEIYFYPLYVRPLTGLGRTDREWDDIRVACYRAGRELLLEQGYTQVSMRMFRSATAPVTPGPVYCCQADGMVGLGCGARSYTSHLHYSNDYAVGFQEVRAILDGFIQTRDEEFARVNYGFFLDEDERRRRYVLLSLLSEEGLSLQLYQDVFETSPWTDLPQLLQLLETGLALEADGLLRLTDWGIERSDAVGPWLFSPRVQEQMRTYQAK